MWFAANPNSLRIKIFADSCESCDSHDSQFCESCESYDSQWFAKTRIMRIIWFAWFAKTRITRIIWFAWFAILRITRIIDSHDSQNMWFAANKNIRKEKYSQRITCEWYDSQITGFILNSELNQMHHRVFSKIFMSVRMYVSYFHRNPYLPKNPI